MTPGIPAMPGPPPASASLSSMLGPQPAMGGQQLDPNAASQGVMFQVRDITSSLDALANQYPEVAADMQQAKQLVVGAMVKIVGSRPAPESPAPALAG